MTEGDVLKRVKEYAAKMHPYCSIIGIRLVTESTIVSDCLYAPTSTVLLTDALTNEEIVEYRMKNKKAFDKAMFYTGLSVTIRKPHYEPD